MEEAQQIIDALTLVSEPFIDQEVMLAVREQGKIVYDGDLTGRPVSNSSTTYPNVAYGRMSDAVQLGYQAWSASTARRTADNGSRSSPIQAVPWPTPKQKRWSVPPRSRPAFGPDNGQTC
jgi:hypothetical protein